MDAGYTIYKYIYIIYIYIYIRKYPKMEVLQNSWMVYFMENPNRKWMIWGYPHLRKPPFFWSFSSCPCWMVHNPLSQSGFGMCRQPHIFGWGSSERIPERRTAKQWLRPGSVVGIEMGVLTRMRYVCLGVSEK